MARPLAAVGDDFLRDPAFAEELLYRLQQTTGAERLIRQEWLEGHWEHASVREILATIVDRWGRAPEPAFAFLQTCWQWNDVCWHQFVDCDMLDDEVVGKAIYQRLQQEGPTANVLATMRWLGANVEKSDFFAKPIMADMVNKAAAQPPRNLNDILRLWRHYGPLKGLHPAAYQMLKDAIPLPQYAYQAMRVVEYFAMKHVRPLLPDMAKLATGSSTQPGIVRARQLLMELSDSRWCKEVASAVGQAPWHRYVAHLHADTQWHLLDFLREHRALNVLADLLAAHGKEALLRGVLTRFLECYPTQRQCWSMLVEMPPSDLPLGCHDAVHYMYMRGRPSPTFFHEALREFPDAVMAIARNADQVRKEVTWARRKLLLCALAAGKPTGHKRARRLEHMLQNCPQAWPVVMQFL